MDYTPISWKNATWNPKERATTWPLQDIIANNESLREKQKLSESDDNGLGFLGQKPEGVPAFILFMIRNQVAPVREVVSTKKLQNNIKKYKAIVWEHFCPGLLFTNDEVNS